MDYSLYVGMWGKSKPQRYLDLNGAYMVLVEIDWIAPSGVYSYHRTCIASNEL